MKTFHNLGLVAALSLLMANPVLAEVSSNGIKVMSPEASQALKIFEVPTTRPVPLIVGNYWTCMTRTGDLLCRLVLVVCTEDQNSCVEIP